MSARRRAATALVAASGLCALAAPAAQAGWDAPRLASAAAGRQAADASRAPALAAGGRYLVFATAAHDLVPSADPAGRYIAGGIVRRDLLTGALELVARGAQFPDGVSLDDVSRRLLAGARSPSVSADGRFVAFVTDEPLAVDDGNGADDVYVRDMTRAAGEPDAYTLVSALDGTTSAPEYTTADGTAPSVQGADVTARTAISADGRTVAFRTAARSSLPAGAFTPAGQVLVRDLDARRTTLMTATPAGDAAGGATGPVALSADGGTAAWVTDNVAGPALAPYVGGEAPLIDALWRRAGGGRVRRITGAGDPDDPRCPAGGTISTDVSHPATLPCDGPLNDPLTVFRVALSATGDRAYLVATAAQRGVLPLEGGREILSIDMRAGVTRKAAYAQLTRRGASTEGRSAAAIDDVAVAPGGRYVAFTTARTTFPDGLHLSGDPSPSFAQPIEDVYVGDLSTGTATLVTRDPDGGKPDGTASEPTVADDGTVAFTSAAGHLVAGDANSAPDVFFATPHQTVLQAAGDALPPPADPVPFVPERRLRATARVLASGSVRITLVGPGLGGVQARLGAKGGRRVALRSGTMPRRGEITLTLTPKLADRRRLRAKGGLTATLRATFRDGAGRLTRDRALHLRAPKPKAKPKTTKKATSR
jgi:hypothetical protein